MIHSNDTLVHAWQHRHFVIYHLLAMRTSTLTPHREAATLVEAPHERDIVDREWLYSLQKIKSDVRNYSAWHYRFIVLTHFVLPRLEGDEIALASTIQEECDMLRRAYYSEPSDEGPWCYLMMIMGYLKNSGCHSLFSSTLKDEMPYIEDLLELEESVPCTYTCILTSG